MGTQSVLRTVIERITPVLVLAILGLYTYAELVEAPYIGFNFNPTTGQVMQVYADSNTTLLPDDRIQRVGSLSWTQFRFDRRQRLFQGASAGDTVALDVIRGDQAITVPWVLPGVTIAEVLGRLLNVWVIGYVFWLAGTATILFVRPKEARWVLLSAFFFITAVWLVTGNVSRWHIWESAVVLRMAIWLAVPIYLHLHWVFPQRLGRGRFSWLAGAGYLIAIVLAGMEWFELLPRQLYYLGFVLAILGSIILLIWHYVIASDQRPAIRLLAASLVFAALPTIVLAIAQALDVVIPAGTVGLLTLPIIPVAYFYLAYQRQLAGIELRANRLVGMYVFLIVLLSAGILLSTLTALFVISPTGFALGNILIFVGVGVTSIYVYPHFQRWVEHRLLGMRLPPTRLLEIYASRITTALDMSTLIELLRNEILPSLLVRRSALLSVSDQGLVPLYMAGVSYADLPLAENLPALLERSGHYPIVSRGQAPLPDAYSWISLILALRVEKSLLGLWLLGGRDPDDNFVQTEVGLIRAIADYSAIALSNIEKTEHLRAIYQENIDRHETERANLARLLHDQVLSDLAILIVNRDATESEFPTDAVYETLTDQLRHIISDLRPVMLDYGLYVALEELASDLAERVGDKVKILFELPADQAQFAPDVEQHLYRIVQQTCDNAIRHAKGSMIRLGGQISPGRIFLSIEDNGVGFDLSAGVTLSRLLAAKHFGLVNIHERAALIGANLTINSTPGKGAKVTVEWTADRKQPPA